MKLMTTTAVLLAAGFAAAPAVAQSYGPSSTPQQAPEPRDNAPAQTQAQGQGPKINVSSKAAKAIQELQTAVKANDTANIPAKVAAAQAVAQNKDDHYAIAQLQLTAALAAKNNAAAAQAIDGIAASGFLPTSRVAELYNAVGVQLYNGKQFDLAASAFQKASAINPQDIEALKLLAEAQNAAGQKAQASTTLLKALQVSKAAGQKPGEDVFKRAVGMAYEAKAPGAVELGREWVTAYPSPDNWHNALAIYRNLNNPDPAMAIDILRLSRATDSLQGTADYHIYAFEAANQANYGEAKSLIAEGIAAGKIKATDPVISDIQGVLKGKAAPTDADLAAAEKTAREPSAFVRVGDRYYGAGNYAKAAELYRQALAKGADKNVANLRLGEALARSGDKAGATAAFSAVTGPQAEIAKFWLVYVQRQG